MVQPLCRAALLTEKATGIVFDPLVPLFEHDIALGQNHFFRQLKVPHAVGFKFHHQLKPIRSDTLEVASVIPRGEGVVRPSIGFHDLRKLPGLELFGSLEEKMFEEMRDPRFAGLLVGRSDAVPDHMRDSRSAVIFDNDDIEPVVETEGRYILVCSGRSDRHQGQQNEGKYPSRHAVLRVES